jgi:hypothetical protein
MKITPIAGPATTAPANTSAMDARARAISMLTGNQPQQQVVQNQNSISAEEMGAIRAPSAAPKEDETIENRQQAISEESAVPQEDTKAAPPAEDPMSRQFAQLARQEKALRAKQQQIQQQEQMWKAKEAELRAREEAITAKPQIDQNQYVSKDQLKRNALKVLEEAGITYEQLTQQAMNPYQRDPMVDDTINELRNEIKALKQATETTQKTYQEQQTNAYQAAVKQIELDVKSLVSNDPQFETIKATESIRDVVDLITQTYEKDGYLLSVEEAAQQVENYLFEEALKLNNLSKMKSRLSQANASTAQSNTAKSPVQSLTNKQPQQMKTLTNATGSNRPLTAKERAIMAFKGEKF